LRQVFQFVDVVDVSDLSFGVTLGHIAQDLAAEARYLSENKCFAVTKILVRIILADVGKAKDVLGFKKTSKFILSLFSQKERLLLSHLMLYYIFSPLKIKDEQQ